MKKKILLIVQTGHVRSTLRQALIDLGYEVETCTNSRSASSMCYSFSPDLIFCQRELPDISGVKLAGLLKSHSEFANTPILLIVPDATTTQLDGNGNVLFTTDDLITFPFTEAALHRALAKWLGDEDLTHAGPGVRSTPVTLPMQVEAVETKQLQTILRGKINCVSLCRLLYILMKNKESGILTVKSSKDQLVVEIRGGTVVDVTSSFIRENSLGNYLVQHKIISLRENMLSLRRMKEFKQPQGQILVWMKSIDQQELDACLSDQKWEKFFRLFKRKWKAAAFQFTPQKVALTERTMQPLPIGEALKTGIFTYTDPDDLHHAFRRNNKLNHPLYLGRKIEQNLQRLGIHKTMIDMARCLEGKSIHDLRQAFPEQFDGLLRLAFLLVINRVAMFQDAETTDRDLRSDKSKDSHKSITKKRVTPRYG